MKTTNTHREMYSILNIQTINGKNLAKQLADISKNGKIIIEIPKSGQLYFSEREVIHEDYLLCAYAYHLLSGFEIVKKEIPPFEEFFSFTFEIKVNEDPDFFIRLAKVLVAISAGYENEAFDPEDSLRFAEDAFQFYSDCANGLLQTESAVLNEYERLKAEWPLDEADL